MRKFVKVLCELNRGTWIRKLSMFLCVIFAVESMWFSCDTQVMAKQENDFSGYHVSGNGLDDVYPEVRYDYCDIDYSYYANEQGNPQVYAPFYLSETEHIDRARTSVSVGQIEYDPYISNPSTITAIRTQGYTDTCWAFATTAAAEVSAIKQGLSDSSQWYSPYHMAYFMYHRVIDPLGGTVGDVNTAVADKSPDFLMGGGNLYMSLFQLSGWNGLVKEEKAPFDTYVSQGKNLDSEMAYDADILMKNGYMLSTGENQIKDFKQAVVEYGGVAIQFQVARQYENTTTGAYYCDTKGSNHAATIVGWDDTYSRENFNEDCRPVSDGAWIIKNSYGTAKGRDGYNYLSYEDQSIAYPVALELMEKDVYDNNYYYDGSFAVTDASVVEVESGGQIANVFTAHASEEGYDESLEAVSIALKSTDIQYKISIYKNLEVDESGVVKPSSGRLMLTQEGKTGRAGVYTIPLEEKICLCSGETFSVVFALQSENGEVIETWMERNYNYGWVTGNANIQKNQSFRRLTSRHTWFDLYKLSGLTTAEKKYYSGLARIKAFTNTLSTISSRDIKDFSITVSENTFVADGTEKCPEVSLVKGTEVLAKGVDFEVEYQNNIAVGEGQIVIRGIGSYTGTVTLPIYLYQYAIDQCPSHSFEGIKCIYCGVTLKEQTLKGTQFYTKEYLDDTFLLDISGNVTDLSFQSDNEEVAVVDENGLVIVKEIGTAKITAVAEENQEYQRAQFEIQIQVQKAQIAEVHLLEEEFYYDGIPHEPSIMVQNKYGLVLTKGKDYTVQYTNNNEIGNATISVTGIGNYTGIMKHNFEIQQLPKELCSHTYLSGTCMYCGYERKVQQISGTLMYEKFYTDKGFYLDAKTNGDSVLTYSSDDASIVTVDEKGYVTIHGTGMAYIYVKAKESALYYADSEQILVEILPGKPEIMVANDAIEKNYGSKAFSLNARTNSDGKITYKSSNKKVATISSKGKVKVKGYGKATLTITTAETDFYEKATKKITIKIVPKRSKLTKVKASGNESVFVAWQKNKTVDGYQVQYSTNKNFKKSVKTKKVKDNSTISTIIGLKKKKTYYFRVRSYKKVGKKTFYGSFSNVKKVKVK